MTDHYLLNMHVIHNASLIRKTLSRHHYTPKPYIEDQQAEHSRLAKVLQVISSIKHAKAQAKAAETQVKNKAARADPSEVNTVAAGTEVSDEPGRTLGDFNCDIVPEDETMLQ